MIGAFKKSEAIESAKQRIIFLEDFVKKERRAANDYCERVRMLRGYNGCVFYDANMFGDFKAMESVRKLKAAVTFMEAINSDTVSLSCEEASLIFGIPNT